MRVFTIGFKGKNAETFFGLLDRPDVVKVIDIRENNTSHLAGFSAKQHLPFFLDRILNIGYVEVKMLAPNKELKQRYFKDRDWDRYERKYTDLLRSRRVIDSITREHVNGGVLLCSEPTSEHCHRRLAAEYLANQWGNVEITHL